jgi:hypothetical protein
MYLCICNIYIIFRVIIHYKLEPKYTFIPTHNIYIVVNINILNEKRKEETSGLEI